MSIKFEKLKLKQSNIWKQGVTVEITCLNHLPSMFPQPMRLNLTGEKKKHTQKHFINDGTSLSLYLFGYVLSRNGRELTY